jgi:UDP-N-acetylglucosamine:LPS N-acetylglucosamine transferase/predicted metal-dependent phosphoesterase TrpH
MKKILILTAGFGDGHNAAARSLRDAIEFLDENSRAEVLDLFADSYGAFNTLARKTYLGMVQYAPSLWGGIYSMLENPFVERQLGGFTRLQTMLEKILNETQPDCVVSTYPVYGHVIKKIFAGHERPFKFITIVTDSITINSAWFRAPGDYFCVANDASADVLLKGGVAEKQIKALGFPVNPIFADNPIELPQPVGNEPRRVLYIINTGKKKAGKAVDRLLELENVHLTITAGRDPELRAKLIERTRDFGDRVKVLGWTNQMPELMMSHHLVISKAGGATVQEAIAARCPMIVNQVIPGQEEGNAELITRFNLGAVVEKNKEVAEAVELAFEKRATLWHEWRKNLKKISRPDAALRIGELILEAADHEPPGRKAVKLFETAPDRVMRSPTLAGENGSSQPQMLLCDFHIHTNYSDGKLSVPEVVDFYGERGFDCICITDHLADPKRLLGKLSELSNMTLAQEQIGEYFAVIERERQRAWRRYKMLVLTGIEFNKDGYTRKTSAHLLGIDLKAPISAALDIPDIIEQIHRQGGLAVASHPHIMKSEWGKNTLYLWENQEKFSPLLDAWEIANRNNIFNDIGLKRLPFIANSDFHKPKHIYSWKTLIHAAKDAEAIKDCIRRNEHVAITLYRDFPANQSSVHSLQPTASSHLPYFQDRLPLRVVNH